MNKPHILLVDDDVMTIQSLSCYLESMGYRVTRAYGCQPAMTHLKMEEKVDLMILDYLMPDGSATDLLRSIGEDQSMQRPPVIMSSGILDAHNPVWQRLRNHLPVASQSLIQAYVNKPYTLDAMDTALQEVLGGDYLPSPRQTKRPDSR